MPSTLLKFDNLHNIRAEYRPGTAAGSGGAV